MNYAKLNASLGPPAPIAIAKKQQVNLTYNKTPYKPPTSTPTQVATASNTPNTIMLRDPNSSTNISILNVSGKLNVGGDARINGTIDTALSAGIVCSSSTGVLSTRLITSADILNFSVATSDIRDGAIISSKLARNLSLLGAPTCNNDTLCSENQIANVGYVNRYVTSFVNKRLQGHCTTSILDCNSDSDEDEFDPSIFHINCANYVVTFKYLVYVIENATAVITMPLVKKEGYSVKFYNKSGSSIVINSPTGRIMFNAMHAPDGTLSQIVENNRSVVFTYVYAGTNRSWSFDYF
jgi:hypothetical protein